MDHEQLTDVVDLIKQMLQDAYEEGYREGLLAAIVEESQELGLYNEV
jgi:hypothetical protein